MRYACEVNRTLRQERSMILAEIAHLDIDEAVAVLISAMNERALEREMVSEVRFRPLVLSGKMKECSWCMCRILRFLRKVMIW